MPQVMLVAKLCVLARVQSSPDGGPHVANMPACLKRWMLLTTTALMAAEHATATSKLGPSYCA
jgi:hypothetical protein